MSSTHLKWNPPVGRFESDRRRRRKSSDGAELRDIGRDIDKQGQVGGGVERVTRVLELTFLPSDHVGSLRQPR